MKKIIYLFLSLSVVSSLLFCSQDQLTVAAAIYQTTKFPKTIQKIITEYAGNYWEHKDITKWAIVIVPVADATMRSAQSYDAAKSAEQLHQELPYSPESGPNSCVRVHQLLFNECVYIKQEIGEEVECEITNAFYTNPEKKAVYTFWTLKKYLLPLRLISKLLCAIPAPYCDLTTQSVIDDSVLTLIEPWEDVKHKITYSAGTRFVRNAHKDTNDCCSAYVIDAHTKNMVETAIPKSYIVCNQKEAQLDTKLSLFLNVLKKWVGTKQDKIPYVWGGCSYISRIDPKDYTLINAHRNNIAISYWERPAQVKPYTGFDCSGMILRAAQICGLCYFFKNTTTLAQFLTPLKPEDVIKAGDLVWIPGHVMVVTDVERAELIHASGYAHGLASVNISKLSQLFQNIQNFTQLQEYSRKKLAITFIDMLGKPVKEISLFAIYRITH